MASVLALWQRVRRWPMGGRLFGRLVSMQAPYFATIAPTVVELEVGRCVAQMRDRRSVRNHIGTVHAIALCNLAEFVGGIGTEASTPRELRWIPKGMTVRYLGKARGTMTAIATIPPVAPGDCVAAVKVIDTSGATVFEADITMWISARK